jgi:metallo-beta-lactamase class B
MPVDIPLGAHSQTFGFHERRERARTEGVQAWVEPDALRKSVAASKAAFEKLVAAEKQESGPSR